MLGSHLDNERKLRKEPDNDLQKAVLTFNSWVGLWVGAEHPKPITGGQVVHATMFTLGGGYQ